ncbi:MAG: T9SS type A sorting domain-containing protein, partial [Candidatus Latescibacterota bacterium]
SWDASDPQGDPMTFDVYFGSSFPLLHVAADHPEQSYDVGPLTPETDHYWKIVARDPDGDETSGPTWMFTTLDLGGARLEVTSFFNYCGLITTDMVTVEVLIVDNPVAIDAGGIDITYDSSVLALVSCEPGVLTSDWQEFDYSDQGTFIRIGGYDLDPIPIGSYGTFAVLTFLSDCCNTQDPVSVNMCPVNPTDGLVNLPPVCGEFWCDIFTPDGDVNFNGEVTPGDALCAFRGYLSFPEDPEGECGALGWDVRSDVDCSNDITPADAACIFDYWLDGSCQFCSPAPPASSGASGAVPPVVSFGDLEIEDEIVSVPIRVSNAEGMRAFGFEVVFPRGLEYAGIDRTALTGSFVAVDAHVLSQNHLRAGGFSGEPVGACDGGDIVVLKFQLESGEVGGAIVAQQFVDYLRGAGAVTYQLGSGHTPQSGLTSYKLYQNYPNPFNPVTTICYEIPDGLSDVPVELTVYDVNGKRIRGLFSGTRSGGVYEVEWDARSDRGVPVSSGIYFYVLRADEQTLRNKMVLLR